MRYLFFLLVVATIPLFSLSFKPCLKGRVDAGAAYAHLEFQEDRVTLRTLDIYGARLDATLLLLDQCGLCIKPFIFGASGNGNFLSYGVGIGHYTPITDRFYVLPLVGGSWTNLNSSIDVPTPLGTFTDVAQQFRSKGVYIGFETGVGITEKLWISYIYQYVWADVKTVLKLPAPFTFTSRGPTQGSNMAVVLDYYVRPSLSLSLGVGYNDSLDRNFLGLRGWGVKLGLAWCFK